ncbi:MAG: mevalonate kinase, partial [Chloroflexi bacterium]|nr:mevalonate kinase [Chloroflexota bacterium]
MSETLLGEGRAPAKVILVGEHAVVYGQPAIALPVPGLEARARVFAIAAGPTRLLAQFPSAESRPPLELDLLAAADDEPLAAAARAALRYAGRTERTPWRIELTSQVPSGRGLGSSAAVAAAVVRAVGAAAEQDWDAQTVADLALEGERRAHGRPSGIDNTVVAFGRPIRFQQGRAEPLVVGAPLCFLVADSGRRGATSELVARVREASEARPGTYAGWFARIGQLVDDAATAIARGNASRLGRLMDLDHLILQAMRVSTPELDALVAAARGAGARGAKLAGSGGGGAI